MEKLNMRQIASGAALFAAGASLAIAHTNAEPVERDNKHSCELEGLPAPDAYALDLSFEQTANGIRDTALLGHPLEINVDNQMGYSEFLSSKGITVIETEGTDEENIWLFALATIPESIVRASGVREIVVVEPAEYDETIRKYEPKHSETTLWAGSGFELNSGLSAMVLDNYCDAENVIREFKQYSAETGHSYDPHYTYTFGEPEVYEGWEKTYGTIFSGPESIRSPREEFISLFRDRLNGWDWYEADLNTALGKKQELVRRIFNDIEPHGEAWQQLHNYGAGMGTHGLPPTRLVARIACMSSQLSLAETEAERDRFLQADAGNTVPDADFVNCDLPSMFNRFGVRPNGNIYQADPVPSYLIVGS